MPRTAAESLDLYYKHRYLLMNPLCRIITGNAGLRSFFERREKEPGDDIASEKVRQVLIDNNLFGNEKARALLGEYADVKAAFTRNANEQMDAFVKTIQQDPQHANFAPSEALHNALLAGIDNDLYATLLEYWIDIENVKTALGNRPQPVLSKDGSNQPAYLMRGDSQSMIEYLNRVVPDFRNDVAARTAVAMNTHWETNQPFSTSSGDTLASLAGRSMIWLIRIDPQTTKGRAGGLYVGEDEVLLPHDVKLAFKGMIGISSSDDVANVDISQFADSAGLRDKMGAIYSAEGNNLGGKKVCFLVSEEEA